MRVIYICRQNENHNQSKTLNNIKQLQKDSDFEKRADRNNSIKLLGECNNQSRGALAEINKIINTPTFTDRTKVQKIKDLIEENQKEFEELYEGRFNQLEQDVDLAIKDIIYNARL